MKYLNPIIFADYSDPDVIRFNDKYIMCASSFNYIPGLPILISDDLVNWELKNYAIKEKLNYEKYNLPCYSQGVWAPSIREHNDIFYIFFGMPDEGIFEVHTTNPLASWSEPQLVKEAKGFIDPCPIWIDDKAYIVHAYAKSRIGFKSLLGIFEFDPNTNKCISDDQILYNGIETNPTIEGPKVYFINDYYYIFAPAGGVTQGWQTVLRSKSIFGPYEEKVVLSQNQSEINGPHQGALVTDLDNNYWFIHFQDKGLYGRITHLQPVKWDNDWPIIGNNGTPVNDYEIETLKEINKFTHPSSDNFNSNKLSLQWQWCSNLNNDFYKIENNELYLNSIFILNSNYCLKKYPNILTQKIIYKSFKVETDIDFSQLLNNEETGLAFVDRVNQSISIRNENHKYNLYLRNEENDIFITTLDSSITKCKLSIALYENNEDLEFSFSINDQIKQYKQKMNEQITSWVGLKIGLYSISNTNKTEIGFTKFKNFIVKEL